MRAGPRGEQSRLPGLALATVGSAPAARQRRVEMAPASCRATRIEPEARLADPGSPTVWARRVGQRPRMPWQAASAVAVADAGDMDDMGDTGDKGDMAAWATGGMGDSAGGSRGLRAACGSRRAWRLRQRPSPAVGLRRIDSVCTTHGHQPALSPMHGKCAAMRVCICTDICTERCF
jgi:hypothetical protein